jgi:TonB-dependent SusC/RagA subfamily outer membrane receptor
MDRFPGVEVARAPGGGVMIRIRGPASFYANSDPLVVVDGVAIEGAGAGIGWLNPHDIASIKVLKNPAETTIWGVRGANGVIVVTTKRPGK